jgi:hypothetical protein
VLSGHRRKTRMQGKGVLHTACSIHRFHITPHTPAHCRNQPATATLAPEDLSAAGSCSRAKTLSQTPKDPPKAHRDPVMQHKGTCRPALITSTHGRLATDLQVHNTIGRIMHIDTHTHQAGRQAQTVSERPAVALSFVARGTSPLLILLTPSSPPHTPGGLTERQPSPSPSPCTPPLQPPFPLPSPSGW